MGRTIYSVEDKQKIIEDYLINGFKVEEIIDTWGCCRGTLFTILKYQNIPLKNNRYKGSTFRKNGLVEEEDEGTVDISTCSGYTSLKNLYFK